MTDSNDDKQGNQEQVGEILTKPRMLDHKNPAFQCKDNKTETTEDYQQMELVKIFRYSNSLVLGITQQKIIH